MGASAWASNRYLILTSKITISSLHMETCRPAAVCALVIGLRVSLEQPIGPVGGVWADTF